MADDRSITVPALSMRLLKSFSFDKILLPRYVNKSANFRGLPFNEEIILS